MFRSTQQAESRNPNILTSILNLSNLQDNLSNLTTTISSGITYLKKASHPITQPLQIIPFDNSVPFVKSTDEDIFSEEEPHVIKLKKELHVAGQILGRVRKTFTNNDDTENLNPIMREWLSKLHGANCDTLRRHLDNWIDDFLLQQFPIIDVQSTITKTTQDITVQSSEIPIMSEILTEITENKISELSPKTTEYKIIETNITEIESPDTTEKTNITEKEEILEIKLNKIEIEEIPDTTEKIPDTTEKTMPKTTEIEEIPDITEKSKTMTEKETSDTTEKIIEIDEIPEAKITTENSKTMTETDETPETKIEIKEIPETIQSEIASNSMEIIPTEITTAEIFPSPRLSTKTETEIQKCLYEEEDILIKYQKEQGRKVQEFVKAMTELFLVNEHWHSISGNLRAKSNLQECIERYVIIKISRKTCIAHKLADFKFWQLLQTYQFIVPKNLDINVPIPPSLLEACSRALTQMNFFKTPRCKLICLTNTCVPIFNYLYQINKSPASVDEFLAILTYVVIKTNPASLISNIMFIEEFRSQNLLLDSWGYFLSNICLVVDFIYKLDLKHLTTGDEISHSLGNEWTLLTSMSNIPTNTTTTTTQTNDNHVTVSLDTQPFEECYKFWNKCPDDIAKEEIPELLKEYKRLALVEHALLYKKTEK